MAKAGGKGSGTQKAFLAMVPEAASIAIAGGLVDCLSSVCLRVS
jgi:hypothetical protein